MVEIDEIATIFKRKIYPNGDIEFIPFKIIEGYYDDDENWFLDASGNTYHHISEFITSGNVYGERRKISFLVTNTKNKKLTFSDMKKNILKISKTFAYYRRHENPYFITRYDKHAKEEYIFEDVDTINLMETPDPENFKAFEETAYSSNEILEPININVNVNSEHPEEKLTPMEITAKVKETIKGQDEAIDRIATTIYLNRKYPTLKKKNILLAGPSGVGKTSIFQALSDILDIPITIFSVAGLSQAGYIGRGTEEILSQIIIDTNKDIERAKKSIVLLDEIDKIAYHDVHSGSVSTQGVQNEILKIIEGDKREVKIGGVGQYVLDTTPITFVGAGAFSELYENRIFNKKTPLGFDSTAPKITEEPKFITTDELVKYGLKRELVGRLPVLVELNNLDKENLKDIIMHSKNSELSEIIKILESYGITWTNLEEVIDLIAEDALKKKIGARGLTSTITEMFLSIFYDIFSNPNMYQELIIGPNILNDKNDYTLIKKETYTKKLIK